MTAAIHAPGSPFGASIKRREDPRFITGKGNYTDDIVLPGTTHAAFVRSPHAHATIRSIDVSAAEALPGVRAVFTGAHLASAGVNGIPVGWLLPDIKLPPRPSLALDRVRHVGEAVAVIIADSAYIARDAVDLVSVDYAAPRPAGR